MHRTKGYIGGAITVMVLLIFVVLYSRLHSTYYKVKDQYQESLDQQALQKTLQIQQILLNASPQKIKTMVAKFNMPVGMYDVVSDHHKNTRPQEFLKQIDLNQLDDITATKTPYSARLFKAYIEILHQYAISSLEDKDMSTAEACIMLQMELIQAAKSIPINKIAQIAPDYKMQEMALKTISHYSQNHLPSQQIKDAFLVTFEQQWSTSRIEQATQVAYLKHYSIMHDDALDSDKSSKAIKQSLKQHIQAIHQQIEQISFFARNSLKSNEVNMQYRECMQILPTTEALSYGEVDFPHSENTVSIVLLTTFECAVKHQKRLLAQTQDVHKNLFPRINISNQLNTKVQAKQTKRN